MKEEERERLRQHQLEQEQLESEQIKDVSDFLKLVLNQKIFLYMDLVNRKKVNKQLLINVRKDVLV